MTTPHHQRIGLGLLGAPEVLTMVELAQLAETRGFESVWVAETRLTRDGITPCAAIAMATTRLKIATGIVNVYTRGAVLTAVSFVSLDEVSQGRIMMGLGTGSPLVLTPQGVAFVFSGPAAAQLGSGRAARAYCVTSETLRRPPAR